MDERSMTSEEWKTFTIDQKMFKMFSDNRYYCTC